MENKKENISSSQPKIQLKNFLLHDSPAMKQLLTPPSHPESKINDTKVRKLYLQASAQQWYPPERVDFDAELGLSDEQRRIWIRLNRIFYILEHMGLNVISYMMPLATKKLKSEEAKLYLPAQCVDETRHVFCIQNYLNILGADCKIDWKLNLFGHMASLGFYRVENWLFSTLFSENFASTFLRRARKCSIDPIGSQIYKSILLDEARHLHFLHTVLPDILDRLSLFGRGYVKSAQYFIMKLTTHFSLSLQSDLDILGIDRVAFIEEVYANVERAYKDYGVPTGFLTFPKVTPKVAIQTQ